MRSRWKLLVALSLAVVSCGPPRSSHPLSDPAAAKPDPRLVGLWTGLVNGSKATLQVFAKTGASLDLVLVGDDGEKGAAVLTFDAFPSALGGKTYLNLRAKTFHAWADGFDLSPDYIFARYELTKDGALSLAVMDDAPVKKAVAAKTLAGTVADDDVTLSASTKDLAEFVRTAKPDELFSSFGTFRRVK